MMIGQLHQEKIDLFLVSNVREKPIDPITKP